MHKYADWLFKDPQGRKGKYVLAEVPNVSLVVFIIFIMLAVVAYPGGFQSFCSIVAYLALLYWSISEARSGRSRFRKLLGYLGIVAVVSACALRLGF